MPSVNNNTTQLGYGLGRDYSNGTSQMISREISRTAIRNPYSDKRLQQLREIVYRMVSTWERSEKMAILVEYGEISGLSRNPSAAQLNEKLTEALLVHLPPADLSALANQVETMEAAASNKVKQIQRDKKTKAKTYFKQATPKTFNEAEKQVSNPKENSEHQYINPRAISHIDPTEKVSAIYTRQYSKLAKEIKNVLETIYNRVELVSLATELGIDVSSDTKQKDLIARITNAVLIYVHVLLGKNVSIGLANSITNTKACEDILQYTSYAYLTGKASLSPFELQAKKNAAIRAKEAIRVRTRMMKAKANITSSEFAAVSGLSGSKRSIRSALRDERDTGILKDASFDELMALASQYGINVDKKISLAKLKEQIYRGMAANASDLSMSKRKTLQGGASILNNRYEQETKIRSAALKLPKIVDNRNSSISGVPSVSLDKSGNVIDNIILKAIPVILVGKTNGGTQSAGRFSGKKDVMDPLADSGYANRNKSIGITELSDEESQLLSLFTSLPIAVEKSNKNISSLMEVEGQLRGMNVSDKNIRKCKEDSGNPGDPDYAYNLGLRYLYLYASRKGYTTLKKYLEINYGIYYKLIKDKVMKVASTVTNILTLGIFRAIGKTKQVGTRLLYKNITNFDDLADASKVFYNDCWKNLKDPEYIQNILLRDGYSREGVKLLIDEYRDVLANGDYTRADTLKKIAILMTARRNGYIDLVKYLQYTLKQDGITKDKLDKYIGKKGSKGKIKSFFRNLFGRRNRSSVLDGSQSVSNEISASYKPENTETTFDKILIDVASFSDSTPITKAVPVLVVNDKLKGLTGNLGKAGLVNHLSGENAKTGYVSLPMNSEELIRKAEDAGHKITSKAILKGAEKGQKVKLKTDDLDFLIQLMQGKVSKKTEKESSEEIKDKISDTAKKIKIDRVAKSVAAPVLVVNKEISYLKDIADYTSILADPTKLLDGKVLSAFMSLLPTANTGAKITRFASGGTAAITGDASGSNIFKGGAKPELVRSNGDLVVQPLNKASNTQTRQKISRMTTSERNQALATSIASHIVKVNYKLSDGATDISNSGEAVKVYSVKPGITDKVDLGGTNVSLMELVAAINAQLQVISGYAAADSSVLATIASNTANTAQAVINSTGSSSSGNQNPFAGDFPDLDSILQGE